MTVVVGTPGNYGTDGNIVDSGQVQVYSYSASGWMQVGADINDESAVDLSGYDVSISANGNIVTIGSPYDNGSGNRGGQVRVFLYDESRWIQMGVNINGSTYVGRFGLYTSISSDGMIFVKC